MPANVTGTLNTPTSVTLVKPSTDTLVQVQLSGTYAGVSGVIEALLDGSLSVYAPLLVVNNATRVPVPFGAVSPANDSVVTYDGQAAGFQNVRFRLTAIASGNLNVYIQSASYLGLPVVPSPTSQAVPAVANGIAAFAGGGQANAVALTADFNRVTTVATANDSVKLPSATVGKQVLVVNAAAANSMNVFPSAGEGINALANDAAFAMAANRTAIFACVVAGKWNVVLTA
jgi:hypothetical protein